MKRQIVGELFAVVAVRGMGFLMVFWSKRQMGRLACGASDWIFFLFLASFLLESSSEKGLGIV